MCGLAGAFHFRRQGLAQAGALAAAARALRHRGPDRQGLWISPEGDVGLAHRRLAIVDLSKEADQPISNEDGSVRAVLNGEIYNHLTLRRELEAAGHRFRSHHGDAEVAVHAFERWGADSFGRLRGMFALALWDGRRRELWLARDRIGIKPLFYSLDGVRLLFASETRPLLDCLGVDRQINPQSVYHYLTLLAVPAPATFFLHIRKLEAGTALRVDERGGARLLRYWDAAEHLNAPLAVDGERARREFDRLLEESVELHSTGDVPLGASLSGGVDSSLIAALLRERGRPTFAIVMDYSTPSDYGEAALARAIAERLGVRLERRTVREEEFRREFDAYSDSQTDSPAGAPDVVLLNLMARQMRESGRAVLLLGEGADELGGYPSYLDLCDEHADLARFAALPARVRESRLASAEPAEQDKFELAAAGFVAPRKHVQSFSEREKARLWRGGPVTGSYHPLRELADEIAEGPGDRLLRQVTNIEFKLRLPEFMLPRVDLPTMLASVEARVPFLDHRLVEYNLRLPFDLKMRGRIPKFLFRQALARRLDESLPATRKIGFGRVLTPLLKESLPAWFQSRVLDRRDHPLFAFVRPEAARELWQSGEAVPNGRFKLWTLYALARWLERVDQPRRRDRLPGGA